MSGIKQQILDLKRVEIAIRGTPDAKRQWLQLMRREVVELLALINREIEKLSPPVQNPGHAESSGAAARETVGECTGGE